MRAPLDPARLRQILDLEKAIGRPVLAEVAGLFLADLPRRLASLHAAAAADDAAGIESVAHSLKGSCANVGAAGARDLCQELETLARRRDVGGVRAMLPRFELEIGRVSEALRDVRESAPAPGTPSPPGSSGS